MIWLRHELWEYTDGLGYRLASRSDTDDTGAPLRGGTLKQIFYAPSPAAAKAQYWALRQLGPIIPSRFESDAPFTLAQLQAQLAQYPDDATLHGQPALHPGEEATAAEAVAEAGAAAEAVAEAGAAAEAVAEAGAEANAAPETEQAAMESLEPWPVVAHAEPSLDDEAAVAEEITEEPEPVSNVVPIRRPPPQDIRAVPEVNAEPQSREMAAMERQPVAAPGALGLALAELGPAAASSGALALALAELEPTPNSMPDDGHPTTGHAPLSLVASQSTSTIEEPPVSETLVAEKPVAVPEAPEAEVAAAEHPAETVEAETAEAVSAEPLVDEAPVVEAPVVETPDVEPLAVEPVAAEAEVAEPLTPEPIAAEKAVEPDPLGPITAVATATAKGKRRKTGFFTGLLRVIMLLLILGGVILGVGLATGTFDGPTLLAQARALPEQARALPDQIRNLSIVKTLLPS